MNIAIFTGEISGDLIGAGLAESLKQIAPDARIWGLGSTAMRAAGVEVITDSAGFGAIGIVEAVAVAPRILAQAYRVVRSMLRSRRPDAVVLVDFGFFNVRLARFARRLGLKTLYYFPPGAWRRDGKPNPVLGHLCNVIATPFIWSVERYRGSSAQVEYVGHPLLERARPVLSRSEFARQFGLDEDRPIVAILPGSRRHEISHLMPVLLDAARQIYRREAGSQFVIAVAPTVSPEMMAGYLSGHTELLDKLQEIWHEFAQEAGTKVWKPVAGTLRKSTRAPLVTSGGVLVPIDALEADRMRGRVRAERMLADRQPPPTVLSKGLTYDVLAHSDVALVCSGTATLEAAVLGTPMVVVYRGSQLMAVEYRLRGLHRKLRFISLPNILANRVVVPELIQEQATPDAIAGHAVSLLVDPEMRSKMRQDLRDIRALLGEPGASERTAKLVVELASRGE